MASESLQDRYAPENRCFGCGPANEQGLRIKSYVVGPEGPGAELVCEWTPEPHHEAFEGMLNGGIIGALLDCHSNWTAVWNLMQARGVDEPPATVTADFHVKLLRPTPSKQPVRLCARVADLRDPKVIVDAELKADDRITSTCRGTFVAVGEDHPAFGRW